MVMEAKKSHDLWSASWKSRKARGAIQSETKGLRARGANCINSSPRAGEDEVRCHSKVKKVEKRG